MARRIALPGDSVSLSAQMADALLRRGSGDAALLYLYLLRHDGFYDSAEVCRTLQWEQYRLDQAMAVLGELGVPTGEPKPDFSNPVPAREDAPDYSRDDVSEALEDRSSHFQDLLQSVENRFGKKLSSRDTKTLLELYDHLGLPAEVLLMVVEWQCLQYADKYGEGRHPPMSYIRTEAYRWKNSGVDTLEAADSYLKKLSYYRSQEGELLAAVGVLGRRAEESERKYLRQWLEWGFSPEAVSIAYNKTLMGTGKMSWSYCNAILRRWHQAGVHTPAEIRTADAPRRQSRSAAASTGLVPQPAMTSQRQRSEEWELEESQRQMKKMLESSQ